MPNITVAGLGYVGLSNAVILAQHNPVMAIDIVPEKIDLLNKKKSPIVDKELQEYLSEKNLNLTATLDAKLAYANADYIVIATPTDYDPDKNSFNTSSIEAVIEEILKRNTTAVIVIKSTVPVGYTSSIREKYQTDRIIFSPEFLREGRALYDNLYPSRIIVGVPNNSSAVIKSKAEKFMSLLKEGALKKDIPTLTMSSVEAEAVKLFSNTYLAMRVAYFNELDTYAELKGLDSQALIQGVSLDPRIGMHYNNPSFGYGGYCLPKDTKQLLANYSGIPNELMGAIVESNTTRKEHVADRILQICHELSEEDTTVGIYRLTMKSGSDNFRNSAIMDVIHYIQQRGAQVIVYEPSLKCDEIFGMKVIQDIHHFKSMCGCIVANRFNDELSDVSQKVYTRDLFRRD